MTAVLEVCLGGRDLELVAATKVNMGMRRSFDRARFRSTTGSACEDTSGTFLLSMTVSACEEDTTGTAVVIV